MSVVYERDNNAVLYTKGAPETLAGLCIYYFDGTAEKLLTDEIRREISARNNQMAAGALRVLAVAYRNIAANELIQPVGERIESELVFAGLVGMSDPPSSGSAGSNQALPPGRYQDGDDYRGDHPSTAACL